MTNTGLQWVKGKGVINSFQANIAFYFKRVVFRTLSNIYDEAFS